MAESLLHASIVLSDEQYKLLRSIHPMYTVQKEIGVITFLGVNNMNKDVVHLLVRFEPFVVHEMTMVTVVMERIFGEEYELMFGNDVGAIGNYLLRATITTKLRKPLRNPDHYIRKNAEAFAKEIVNWRREQVRRHRQEEDKHLRSFETFDSLE